MKPGSGLKLALGCLAAPLGICAPALAQEAGSGWSIKASASVVGAAIDGDSALAPAGDGFLFSGDVLIRREDVLDNGLQLVWRLEGRVERDASSPAARG